MDEERKRRLKRLGKRLVEERSRRLEELCRRANPAPFGSEAWMRAHRAGIEKERALRAAPPDRMRREEVRRDFVLLPVETGLRRHGQGVPTWYYECSVCGTVVHSVPRAAVACACGNLRVDATTEEATTRSFPVRLVKLIGRA